MALKKQNKNKGVILTLVLKEILKNLHSLSMHTYSKI